MHIVLLTDGITPFVTGGMQRHSANLAKYFTLAGVKVSLVHCVDEGVDLPSDEEVNKSLFGSSDNQLYKIYSFHFPAKGKMIGHYIRNSYLYSKLVIENIDFSDIDFVYAKGFVGWRYIELRKKNPKLPPIGVKFHGYEMFQNKKSFKEKLKSLLLKGPTVWNNENADFVFSYGGKITDLILKNTKVAKNKILEFPSGIGKEWLNESFVLNNTKEKTNFVFVGRYETRKGVKELNIALAKFVKKEKFNFHFVGPIPDDVKIDSSQIVYHGELNSKEKLQEILDVMDVLVCPSHSEGMPNVILEGMARGLAVLATDVGAVEFIVDDSNGIIIPPLNQTELEQAFVAFCQLPQKELDKLKKSSLDKVRNEYLWEKLAFKIIKSIKEVA